MTNRLYEASPLLDGWGANGPFYDHRYAGYDKAPKDTVYISARPIGPYLKTLHPLPKRPTHHHDDEMSSGDDDDDYDDDYDDEDEDDDEDYDLEVYGHVDMSKVLGQQLAVWCHRTPDTLAIFTPVPGDTLHSAVNFAKSTLQCDTSKDKVLVLIPDNRQLVDPSTMYSVKPGSSILVVPRYDLVVALEATQLDTKLEVVVSLTMTVRSLKQRLQRERGFQADRTDLLYRDEPMENQRHLFDYRIANGTTMFAMFHLVYDVKVRVETFWGTQYELYVDPCMTTACLLKRVLRRTVTAKAGDPASYFHLALPRHALVMYTDEGVAMKWNGCLGKYNVSEGCVLNLSTIALAHRIDLQTVPVLIQGKVHRFRMSKLDYWSVLALKVHGLKGYPVNLIRLYHKEHELDQRKAVGHFPQKSPAVLVDASLLRTDEDITNGVDLQFRLGDGGISEVITCSPARSVRSVKTLLEDLGVPNAASYDLYMDGYRLPGNGRIGDVVEEYKKPIDLKLRQYPVFVHGPNNVIYKMNAHANEPLKAFKSRVEMKTGLSQMKHYLLMAGLPLEDEDNTPLFQSHLTINCSVFLLPVQQKQTFLLLTGDWLVKLRLPFQPSSSEIKNILWKDRNVPEGCLASVGNFMQWYFVMKANTKGLLADDRKDTERDQKSLTQRQSRSRSRKRHDSADTDVLLWHNTKQIQQLQKELEKRELRLDLKQGDDTNRQGYHQGKHNDTNRPGHDLRKHNTTAANRHRNYHGNDDTNRKRYQHYDTEDEFDEGFQRRGREGEEERRGGGRYGRGRGLYARPPLPPTKRRQDEEVPGIYYATEKDTRWQRLNPEDLANKYLRACSLPPDPAVRVRDLHERQNRRNLQHKSSMSDIPRKRNPGNIERREPQWVHSVRRLSREEEVPPAVTGLRKRRRHKKRQ